MTAVYDEYQAKMEVVYLLRSGDVFTITQRGVTTTTDNGTFASSSSHLINRTNVKNIRSITVASVLLDFGTDYSLDLYYDDSGTKKAKITFASAQTGDYAINYDYGTDKIFPDFPMDEISLSEYPRIAVDWIGGKTENLGIGGLNSVHNGVMTIVVFAEKAKDAETYIKSIRTLVNANKKALYYHGFLWEPSTGPMLNSLNKKAQVLQKNIDFTSRFNFEET